MQAVCWQTSRKVTVEQVPDPKILNPRDIIVRQTLTTICGSDLHIFDGFIPSMQAGDIIGHEIVGEVVEVGSSITKFKIGDRVVASSIIGCGNCWYCQNKEYSFCDNSNPNAALQEKMFTYPTAGIFGYSHLFGGYAGAQAQYIRVPYADVIAFKIPEGMSDEAALSCSDAFPTGYMGADLLNLKGGETVAVWGAGPVGLFAMKSAYLLGAERVIAIDNVPERLRLAREICGAVTLNQNDVNIREELKEMTGGIGPDCCIEAVGMEAHGSNMFEHVYDRVKQAMMMETGRPGAMREIISCCRKGGTISMMGVFAGLVDKFPLGIMMNKGLHLHTGQMHGPKYIPRLFEHWQRGDVDPGFVFSHQLPLASAPEAYKMFRDKQDNCIKIALKP